MLFLEVDGRWSIRRLNILKDGFYEFPTGEIEGALDTADRKRKLQNCKSLASLQDRCGIDAGVENYGMKKVFMNGFGNPKCEYD